MRRGTTPTHIYTLPFDTSQVEKLSITYAQEGKNVLKKTERDVAMDGNTVKFKMTQEESLGFSTTKNVKIQIKVLTTGNDVLVSDIWTRYAYECLDEEVL